MAFTPDTLKRIEAAGLDPDRLPRHVAVIMDGNGRWAQERGLPRQEGHRRGVRSVRSTIEESCRLGVGQLTLYCLSSENWKRPKTELDFLMVLLQKYLIDERAEIMEQNIRFSANNTGMILCLAINYGARTEMVDAVRQLAEQAKKGTLQPGDIDES